MSDGRKIKDYLMNVKPICYIILFYIFSVVVHIIMNIGLKVINVYPDELRFYDMAKNMYNGIWFTVRGIKLDYQKILYSVFLCPFFMIKDAAIRLKMISVANCIVMCSSIFPMYILYKYMYKKENRKISDMWFFFLFSISSMFLYTITYMSENIYVPIYLWGLVLFIKGIKNDKKICIVLSSIVFYINYICREIMVIYVAALVVTVVFYMWKEKNELKNVKIKDILIFVATFLVMHIICKLTIFRGLQYTYLEGTYNQIGMDVLNSIDIIWKLIKSSFYYIASVCIVFLFFPIVILFNEYKKMSIYEKILLISNALNIVFLSGVIAYTISIREDVESSVVRLHLRYSIVSIAIIFFIFCKHFNMKSIKEMFVKKHSIVFFVLMVVFSLVFFNGINSYSIDFTQLQWYRFLRMGVNFLINEDLVMGEYLRINIVFILVVLTVCILYVVKKYNIVKSIGYVFILFVFILNNIYGGYVYNSTCPSNTFKETKKLNDFFSKMNNVNILYITNAGDRGDRNAVMDIFFEQGDNKLIYSDIAYIKEKYNGKYDVKDMIFYDSAVKKEYSQMSHIDYIMIDNMEVMRNIRFNNMEELEQLNMRNYIVYKNNDRKIWDINIE